MKKIIQKRLIIAIAVGVLFIGFYIDRKDFQFMGLKSDKQCQFLSAKKHNKLTIHNQTGAKINTAFYNKRFRRNGLVFRMEKETMSVPCCTKNSYVAVSRNDKKLARHLTKSVPHAKIKDSRCVKIKSKGQNLVVTTTGK